MCTFLFVHLVELMMLYGFFSNVNFIINFSWQEIEYDGWCAQTCGTKIFHVTISILCMSFLFFSQIKWIFCFSVVHLFRSVHEICLEGPTAEHAAVCMSFLKWIRTTLSTNAFLWLPVSTELPLQPLFISLEITFKIKYIRNDEWNFDGNHKATCVSIIVEFLCDRILWIWSVVRFCFAFVLKMDLDICVRENQQIFYCISAIAKALNVKKRQDSITEKRTRKRS